MTVQEAYKQLLAQLYELYDNREAANIADLVIEQVTGQRRIDRIVNKLMPVSAEAQQQLIDYAQQLLQHAPVQYVLHEAWFAGLEFYVDDNVLIPRPETEELVSWIADCGLQIADWGSGLPDANEQSPVASYQLSVNKEDINQLQVPGYRLPVNQEDIKQSPVTSKRELATGNRLPATGNQKPETGNQQPVTVLDIGTGPGCIPIALKHKFPQWNVHGLDVSEGALRVAQRNAVELQTPVTFHRADILDEAGWEAFPQFDIIVSNPPYIKQSEEATMHDNVTRFEPHTALFVPDEDALLFYKKIADFAVLHLRQNGLLFFEINEALGKEVCELLLSKGFTDVELKKDLQGKDRMVRACYSF